MKNFKITLIMANKTHLIFTTGKNKIDAYQKVMSNFVGYFNKETDTVTVQKI